MSKEIFSGENAPETEKILRLAVMRDLNTILGWTASISSVVAFASTGELLALAGIPLSLLVKDINGDRLDALIKEGTKKFSEA